MVEKRNHKRVRVNLKVSYNDDAYTNVTATVIDISKGGMYVLDAYAPEAQENITASIDADDLGKIVWVEGRVVRKTDTGIGVMFTSTDKLGLVNILNSESSHF